jgi:ABC-type cobalamin/Fe3+-siderophores transport system ATPase subunit
MIAPSLLRVDHASIALDRRPVLHDITLSLEPGSMTVLLGPNGSGKTTLLRVLAGVIAPGAGVVRLGDVPLRSLGRAAVARHCAYLPQQTGTDFEIKVEDAVALGRYPHIGSWGALTMADHERVTWALGRVGLGSLRSRTLPTLSGGERQRAFIARALVQDAPILLLDEPISSLDIGHQLGLMELLAELHREGRTILASLHDLRPALEFFPHAVLLSQGRIAATGPTGAVLHGEALAAAFGVHVDRAEQIRFRRPAAPG